MIFKKEIILCFLLILLISNSLIFCQNVGSEAYIQVNEIHLPFNNRGVIADVNINPIGHGGLYAGEMFLYSSGFWLSGYSNDSLWANGVSSASLVLDYQPGIIGMDPNDPKASIYKLTSSDTPFGQSWQDWIDAVALGADFYDGNNDGIYNPVDLNGNNQWDPDEDKPDLLLDETYWCVYNDGVPANMRRWEGDPFGIEVRQTIFAESSTGATSNTVFVRYRIKNTGLVSDTLKDVYFSMWADADVGDPSDDITGCDTIRQGIYFYNNTPDQVYGNQVPSFMMDMLASPPVYIPGVTFIDINGNNIYENGIDTPLDTAVNFLGPLGIRIYPGTKDCGLSSAITSFKNTPGYSDPDFQIQVRNYMLGLTEFGQLLDPCTLTYGEVRGGVDCSLVNPLFWFSGDPVIDVGWICNKKGDLRAAGTTGPFTLVKDQGMEILIGYEVANSSTPLGGITAVRVVSDEVQSLYENNFGYTVVSVENESQVSSSFMLEQNYPNPFNPSTKIKFSIPLTDNPFLGGAKGGLVTLKVYDVLGNEIATLVNEEKPAGTYEITWYPENLPSGVYIYQLRANNYIETRKMLLLK